MTGTRGQGTREPMRVLVLATTTGYQTRAFGEAATRLGAELMFATDRCHLLEDPWQDAAVPIRFYDEDASVAAILKAAAARAVHGLVVVGDRPTVIAARAAEALGLPWHPPAAAAIARHKQFTRERLRDAGLPVPWFFTAPIAHDHASIANRRVPTFPCVVKPVSLSGSRGVMRANDRGEFDAVVARVRALMQSPEIRAERDAAHETMLVEGFIPGREYAVEGLMHDGALHVLAIFDKPDPLDGPIFEETIYVTPSSASAAAQDAIADAISRAAAAIGLRHGPIHAECRINDSGVYVLEVAARPIGGLCASALAFRRPEDKRQNDERENDHRHTSLEELLLRHALGEDVTEYRREASASGVMMVPIPRRGIYRGVEGAESVRAVPGVSDVRITAKLDQVLLPLPEGATYLGFIFARAARADDVDRALRAAHARLTFSIDPEFPVLPTSRINYNQQHG